MGARVEPAAVKGGRNAGARTDEGTSGETGMFLMINRNKRAMTLNLKRPEGREILLSLLEDADILLEGFRPDAMKGMGFGYDDLKEKYPRLIYCAISGYGANGPYKPLAGHDGNYIAHSGLLGITGIADGPPVLPGFQTADIGGGTLPALASILAALYAREKTGRGQFLDISMMDGAFSFLTLHAGECLASGKNPERGRMALSGALPNYNVYRCRDGRYVMLGALEERFFRAFLRKAGREELLEGRTVTAEGVADLKPEIEAIFASRTRDEWSEFFENPETCLAPVNSIQEALKDPQLRERGMIITMEHPALGEILLIGSPFRFSETPCTYRLHPPAHGEHTDGILASLGLGEEEIAELRKKRVI